MDVPLARSLRSSHLPQCSSICLCKRQQPFEILVGVGTLQEARASKGVTGSRILGPSNEVVQSAELKARQSSWLGVLLPGVRLRAGVVKGKKWESQPR